MRRGVGLVLGPPSARFSLLYVEDLADALVRLVQTDGLASAAFELHDGRPAGYAWDDVLAAVGRLRGRAVRRVAGGRPGAGPDADAGQGARAPAPRLGVRQRGALGGDRMDAEDRARRGALAHAGPAG